MLILLDFRNAGMVPNQKFVVSTQKIYVNIHHGARHIVGAQKKRFPARVRVYTHTHTHRGNMPRFPRSGAVKVSFFIKFSPWLLVHHTYLSLLLLLRLLPEPIPSFHFVLGDWAPRTPATAFF